MEGSNKYQCGNGQAYLVKALSVTTMCTSIINVSFLIGTHSISFFSASMTAVPSSSKTFENGTEFIAFDFASDSEDDTKESRKGKGTPGAIQSLQIIAHMKCIRKGEINI